jgi:C-terminal processing protease CtpA/Prc
MKESLTLSDDNSFERQYGEPEERIEIFAPAGKLGIVIDTPNGGVPMVHAIKESSVLIDRVKVGDKLVMVDGIDTTTMSAIKVSRLISTRSDNPRRVLIFLRYHMDE